MIGRCVTLVEPAGRADDADATKSEKRWKRTPDRVERRFDPAPTVAKAPRLVSLCELPGRASQAGQTAAPARGALGSRGPAASARFDAAGRKLRLHHRFQRRAQLGDLFARAIAATGRIDFAVRSALLASCPQRLPEPGAPTVFSLLFLREFHGAGFST